MRSSYTDVIVEIFYKVDASRYYREAKVVVAIYEWDLLSTIV